MTGETQQAGDSGALVSNYEEIRREVLLRGGGSGRGSGIALFIRRGMAAWLAACAPLTSPALESHRRKLAGEDHLPADMRTEVAMILAEMALTAVPTQGAATC